MDYNTILTQHINNQQLMKPIKHIINLAFLWSLPYAALLFFWLLTLCQFSYTSVITSTVWAVIIFFYTLFSVVIYSCNNGSEDDITLF